MGLNDIEFPPSLMAELYSSLIIPDEKINAHLIQLEEKKREDPSPAALRHLGENRKKILVITKDETHPFASDEDLQFLTDILAACKLSLADIALVNLAHGKQTLAVLRKEFDPGKVLCFGMGPDELEMPIRFPAFQVQSYSGTQFIASPTLRELSDDKLLKSKLWVSLRKLFNI